jgi:hypothetical protein
MADAAAPLGIMVLDAPISGGPDGANAGTLGVAIAGLVVFGLGWGFFDCNNMPILCQIVRPELRATGYGFMNLVSISCGGFGDWGFGYLRDRQVPLNLIFGAFAGVAALSFFSCCSRLMTSLESASSRKVLARSCAMPPRVKSTSETRARPKLRMSRSLITPWADPPNLLYARA